MTFLILKIEQQAGSEVCVKGFMLEDSVTDDPHFGYHAFTGHVTWPLSYIVSAMWERIT